MLIYLFGGIGKNNQYHVYVAFLVLKLLPQSMHHNTIKQALMVISLALVKPLFSNP